MMTQEEHQQEMNIIVVGAGIGGLAAALSLSKAGHKVTVLESASELAEIGAGVQFTPNTTKWLWKWGLAEDILSTSALPGSFNVLDGRNGSQIGSVDFSTFEQKYGGPYLVIHRADIHRILHDHALRHGAEIKLNCRVKDYFPEEGRVLLPDGIYMSADLVVAVDGIHSHARKYLIGKDAAQGDVGNNLEKAGWAGYRLMADISALCDNEQTHHLTTTHNCNCATGNKCSIMTYQVKNAEKLNLVLSHPDDVDTTKWTQQDFQQAIRDMFKDFGPSARTLLDVALSNPNYTISNWPVHQVVDLPRWKSDSGKLVLMGDAAHAMAYFLSIGVSMAVEDAVGLTTCLELMHKSGGRISLSQAMALFEEVRKPRAQIVRDASANAGRVLMLPPGKEQDQRDQYMKADGGESDVPEPKDLAGIRKFVINSRYGIIDKGMREWLYNYDVAHDIEDTWKQRFRS